MLQLPRANTLMKNVDSLWWLICFAWVSIPIHVLMVNMAAISTRIVLLVIARCHDMGIWYLKTLIPSSMYLPFLFTSPNICIFFGIIMCNFYCTHINWLCIQCSMAVLWLASRLGGYKAPWGDKTGNWLKAFFL